MRCVNFELNACNHAAHWTPAEKRFHEGMQELREVRFSKLDVSSPDAVAEEIVIAVNETAAVGATGTKFEKTREFKVMTHAEALQDPWRKKVMKAFNAEHKKFLKCCVWKAINERKALPTDEMLDTTTVSKFKPNGDCRGRVLV